LLERLLDCSFQIFVCSISIVTSKLCGVDAAGKWHQYGKAIHIVALPTPAST
jgi:hypothetical protein